MRNLKKRGFTLIEMLIVVVIIGILAAALIPRLGSAKGKANDASRNTALSQIGTAFGVYAMDYGYGSVGATGGSTNTMSGFLKLGGLPGENLPKDPKAPTTIFGHASAEYVIIPVSRGTAASGYIVAARVESPASANWVETAVGNFSGSLDVTASTFSLCSSVTEGQTLGQCVYTPTTTDKLRKIVVY